MSNEFIFSGIDEFDKVIGGLKRGGNYLLSGASGTGKSLFVMQLIKRIMAEEEKVILVTGQDPQVFLNLSQEMEIPLDSFMASNDLIILKQVTQSHAVIADSAEFTNFLTDLGNLVVPVEASVIIFDSFIPVIGLFSDDFFEDGVSALLFELKQMGLMTLLSTKMPTSRKALMIRKYIEDRVTGSFHLDEHLKEDQQISRKLIIRKMEGMTPPYPVFKFRITKGVGLEITERSSTDLQVVKNIKESKQRVIQEAEQAQSFSFLKTMKKEQEIEQSGSSVLSSKSEKKASSKLSFKDQYKEEEKSKDKKRDGKVTFTDVDKEQERKPVRKVSFLDKD